MKRQITKDISSYFPVVSKKIANHQTDKDFLELELRISQANEPPAIDESKEQNDGDIDYKAAFLDQFDVGEEEEEENLVRVKERREQRPSHWREIIREFNLNGYAGLRLTFPEFFVHENGEQISDSCLRKRIQRYQKDLKSGKTKSRGGSIPPYGMDIDNELCLEVKQRRSASLPVNDMDLQHMLLNLLHKHNMSNLHVTNGGKYHFGSSWAARFCKRHDLRSKKPTSKARENPTNSDGKVEKFVDQLSIAIYENNIPPALVISCDETGLNFVSNSKKIVESKEASNVRMCGVGRDKAQITCTLACSEAGDVLKPQLIFAGKTNRCFPSTKREYLYTFTDNHWQNGISYLEFLKEVIVPYKLKKVKELGLPVHQRCVLIQDLHFSHLTADVREYAKKHNIALIHIPAGCTDSLQVCDTIINAPFKAGAQIAFKKLISECYEKHVDDGNLKEYISDFVAAGITAITTDDMRISISNGFQKHARLTEARSEERYRLARERIPVQEVDESEEREADTVEKLLGSSSEDDDEGRPLILKLPRRLVATVV